MRMRSTIRSTTTAIVASGLVVGLLAATPGGASATLPAHAAAISAAEENPEIFKIYTVDSTKDRAGAWRDYAEMMRTPSEDNQYKPKTLPPINGGGKDCPRRRCVDTRIPVPKGVKVSGSQVRVILPRGYRKKKNRKKRYPVVYLFNGALSPYDTWSKKTELVKIARNIDAIFVSPDGGTQPLPGTFSDWYDDTFDYETYHVNVVVPWVDRKFRTFRHGRALVGPSLGSIGALNYPAHHPGKFAAALSVSGIVDTNMLRGNTVDAELAETLGISPPDLRRVWGHPILNNDNWDHHNPTMNVDAFKETKLFIASGTGYLTGDPDAPNAVHTGYYEWLVWQGHRTFLASLIAGGVPFQARIRQGGIHNWPYFDDMIRWGFPKIVQAARQSEIKWRKENRRR